MGNLAAARFPAVPDGKGHYESWYLKAGEPGGRRSVWIRYTVHQRPNHPPEGSLWFTLFDLDSDRPSAVKQTAGPDEVSAHAVDFVAVGELGIFGPRRAEGSIRGEGREASWQLDITGDEPLLRHLPDRLYGTSLPRTKLLTVNPEARFTGSVEVDGRRVELDGWPGMIGHNWGANHAERWVWMHGTDFDDHGPNTWLDFAFGQVKLGPWTTPWIVNGEISLDGDRHRIGGIGRSLRGTRVEAQAGSCSFTLPGAGLTVSGQIRSPVAGTVAWLYSDPDGSTHHTLNCSVSQLELEIERPEQKPERLSTTAGGVYEYGSRDFTHGIPLEPFSDG